MKAAAILIGAGFVGKAHVDALRRLGVEVRGVVGSSAERSEEARAALGLPRAYGSIDEAAMLVARADDGGETKREVAAAIDKYLSALTRPAGGP